MATDPGASVQNGAVYSDNPRIDTKAIIDKISSLAVQQNAEERAFELLQREANMFSKSNLIPDSFKGNLANCAIAIKMARSIGADPLIVMQNIDIIYGRPFWRATFVVGTINASGRFGSLRYRLEKKGKQKLTYDEWTGKGDSRKCVTKTIEIDEVECVAYAKDKAGEVLESPTVSISMAIKEGWYTKSGSKWVTMPELMLRYRAATLFGRLYCPEILMGLQTTEEAIDAGHSAQTQAVPKSSALSRFEAQPETVKDDGEIVDTHSPRSAEEPTVEADNPVDALVLRIRKATTENQLIEATNAANAGGFGDDDRDFMLSEIDKRSNQLKTPKK